MEEFSFSTRPLATKVIANDDDAHMQASTIATQSASKKMPKCQLCIGDVKANAPYVCPRCSKPYCSLRCYKSDTHVQCSEQFYRECVKSELEGKMCDERGVNDVPDDLTGTRDSDRPFYLDCPIDFSKRTPNASASDANDECDEEDHSKDYIHLVEMLTRESAEKMQNTESLCENDDEEIDRQLLARGISDNIEELLSQLTTEERANFETLCTEFDVHQTRQLERSVFRKRDRK